MGLKVGEVKLEKWTPKWREDFELEEKCLAKIFGNLALSIQHVGSTSIKNLDSKPIIDIAVGLNKLTDFEKVRRDFVKLSEYSIKEDNDPGEILIRKGSEENRTHFIHIMEQNSERMRQTIQFREILKSNQEVKREYENLKHNLAERFPYNRKSYTAGKADFITRVLSSQD